MPQAKKPRPLASAFIFSVKYLEFISLGFQPFNRFRKCKAKFVETLERVVEGDYRTIAGIALHIIYYTLGCHPLGIVAGDEVPHHYAIFATEPGILVPTHPSMGRTEEIGVKILICQLGIAAIGRDSVSESANVVEGVVAYAL